MGQLIATIILIPIMLWSVFQPMLYHNASMTQETLKISLYEIQKKASIQGKYDEALYSEFKTLLADNHGYDPACIVVEGTEVLTERGGSIDVTVSIPKPVMSFFDIVDMSSCDRPDSYTPFVVTQTIKSEYIP